MLAVGAPRFAGGTPIDCKYSILRNPLLRWTPDKVGFAHAKACANAQILGLKNQRLSNGPSGRCPPASPRRPMNRPPGQEKKLRGCPSPRSPPPHRVNLPVTTSCRLKKRLRSQPQPRSSSLSMSPLVETLGRGPGGVNGRRAKRAPGGGTVPAGAPDRASAPSFSARGGGGVRMLGIIPGKPA
jgi:hypothetical protein